MKKVITYLQYGLIATILVLIIRQLRSEGTLQIVEQLRSVTLNTLYVFLLMAIIGLMVFNWYLEGKKWQLLMSPFEAIHIRKAIKIVLAGIATGIFTPGRVGEYAGRALTSDKNQKPEVITATLLGSIAQNFWNIAGGLTFSYYFLKNVFSVTNAWFVPFTILIAIQIVLLLLLYYHLPKAVDFVTNNTWLHKYKDRLTSLRLYSSSLLHRVLLLSLLRYAVYVGQYVLIMIFLHVEVSPGLMLANITGIYLIQTGIPLPTIMSIIARGELAILVWSASGVSSIIALAATFLLWFINLIIPALGGLYILTKTNFYQYFKKEDHA
ncbi:MAG: flippase-like domain-containing protein [Chitinophagales bacterium]|nr:flippase-like domain-containing protein [Chitinophagales bacterium]